MISILDKILHNIESKATLNEHLIMSNRPIDQMNVANQYYELYVMPKLDFVTVFTIRMWVASTHHCVDFQVIHGDKSYPTVHIDYSSPGHGWTAFMQQLTECFSYE